MCKVFNEKLNISRHQPSVDKSVQVNRKSPKFNLLPENLFLELDIRLGFVCSMLHNAAACPAEFLKPRIFCLYVNDFPRSEKQSINGKPPPRRGTFEE